MEHGAKCNWIYASALIFATNFPYTMSSKKNKDQTT